MRRQREKIVNIRRFRKIHNLAILGGPDKNVKILQRNHERGCLDEVFSKPLRIVRGNDFRGMIFIVT